MFVINYQTTYGSFAVIAEFDGRVVIVEPQDRYAYEFQVPWAHTNPENEFHNVIRVS